MAAFSSFFSIHFKHSNSHQPSTVCDWLTRAYNMNTALVIHQLFNVNFSLMLMLIVLNENISLILSQLVGSEKTMEQFLDRLLHESVYDRRIRPFYTDSKSKEKKKFHFSCDSYCLILTFKPPYRQQTSNDLNEHEHQHNKRHQRSKHGIHSGLLF